MFRSKRAQSTLEYIIVFSAIVAAILIVATIKLKPAAERMVDAAANEITEAADSFNTLVE